MLCERGSEGAEWGYRWNFPPVSNFLLTSRPVADEWLCQGVHGVRPGDTLLSSTLFHMKLQHQKLMVKQQLTIRELWIVQFLWQPSANNRPVCGYFSDYKKGKLSSFISLFACWFLQFGKSVGVSAMWTFSFFFFSKHMNIAILWLFLRHW